MYLRKIKNKTLHILNKNKKIIKAVFFKIINKSDHNRWQDQKALFPDWDERTQLLANHIKPNSTVFEFGAARMSLKSMLPVGCTYYHSDLVKRAEDTLVADLNQSFPEIPPTDVIVFSGVLEYLNKVPQLFHFLKDKSNVILFSYASLDSFPNLNSRRKHGWISDHTLKEFSTLAEKCGYQSHSIGQWRKQHLFKWSKTRS